MDFDALVEAQTGLGTAAVIVMNKQVLTAVQFSHAFPCQRQTSRSASKVSIKSRASGTREDFAPLLEQLGCEVSPLRRSWHTLARSLVPRLTCHSKWSGCSQASNRVKKQQNWTNKQTNKRQFNKTIFWWRSDAITAGRENFDFTTKITVSLKTKALETVSRCRTESSVKRLLIKVCYVFSLSAILSEPLQDSSSFTSTRVVGR